MFLIDKYTPKTIDKTFFHKTILDKLIKLSKDESIPHIIFYGPEGSGKKTIINIFLELLFDSNVHNMVDSTYKIAGSGNTTTNEIIKQSNYHIVIEPRNNNSDKNLIQGVVYEYAKRVPLNVFKTRKTFKVVLINNIDKLPRLTQTALRRTMEKYSKTCRFILWTSKLSKVIDPLISRCLTIRIPSPSNEEMLTHLQQISKLENINVTPKQFMEILDKSDGNIKLSLWMLELLKYNHDFKLSMEDIIKCITSIILTCRIELVRLIRILLYKAMVTNIPEVTIIINLCDSLLLSNEIPESLKFKIINICSTCEYNLVRCRREILHLECFVQKVICLLHNNNEFKPFKISQETFKKIVSFMEPKDLKELQILIKYPKVINMIEPK